MRIDPPDTESTFDTAADDSGDITIRDERGYLRNLKLLTPAELIAPGVCPAEPVLRIFGEHDGKTGADFLHGGLALLPGRIAGFLVQVATGDHDADQ